jgi:hypothetical protein
MAHRIPLLPQAEGVGHTVMYVVVPPDRIVDTDMADAVPESVAVQIVLPTLPGVCTTMLAARPATIVTVVVLAPVQALVTVVTPVTVLAIVDAENPAYAVGCHAKSTQLLGCGVRFELAMFLK